MEQVTNRRQLLKTLGAGSVLGVAGCLGGDGGSDAEATIKMGILAPQSGELADIGQSIVDAMKLATTQVNDADNGVTVDVQIEDTETNPLTGVSGAEALVDEGYPMICGAVSSDVSGRVIQEVAVPNSTVMCSPVSTAPSLSFVEDNRLFFRTAPDDSLQGQALASITAERLENENAAVMHVNDTYGQELASNFVNEFETTHSGTVYATVDFESGRPTYVSQIGTALSEDPETLLLVAFPESGAQILSDINRSYDVGDLNILVSNGNRFVSFPQNVDPSNIGGTSPGVNGPGLNFFNERYQEEYGREPGIFNHHAYDAAAILMLAHARADDPQGESLRNQIWWNSDDDGEVFEPENLGDAVETAAGGDRIAYGGASSPVNFDARGDLSGAVYNYFQYTAAGEIETLGQVEV